MKNLPNTAKHSKAHKKYTIQYIFTKKNGLVCWHKAIRNDAQHYSGRHSLKFGKRDGETSHQTLSECAANEILTLLCLNLARLNETANIGNMSFSLLKRIIKFGGFHKRFAQKIGILVLLAAISISAHLGFLRFTGNFHPVITGELYRAAQPTAPDIARYKEIYGIKTIVNLRGEDLNAPWYNMEIAEAKRQNISHIDFRMSADQSITQATASDLIQLLQHAEKPVLIHCQAGADRSGLAAALYVAAISQLGEAAAERQISFRYGHISLPISSAYAMDKSFETLEPWLGYSDS